MASACPLCLSHTITHFSQDKLRDYWQCAQCALVFVKPEQQLSLADEKAIYDTHQNTVDDLGYQKFLSRAADPLLAKLNTPSEGLDFGCGPGPALAHMLSKSGHSIALYDLFYHPDKSVLSKQYDFVTCTEVIEHFVSPAKDWSLLLSLVKPGGWLVVMTKLVIDQTRFASWHYKNDQTHVSFFSRTTFDFLAQRDGLTVEYIGNDVMLFKKR